MTDGILELLALWALSRWAIEISMRNVASKRKPIAGPPGRRLIARIYARGAVEVERDASARKSNVKRFRSLVAMDRVKVGLSVPSFNPDSDSRDRS